MVGVYIVQFIQSKFVVYNTTQIRGGLKGRPRKNVLPEATFEEALLINSF